MHQNYYRQHLVHFINKIVVLKIFVNIYFTRVSYAEAIFVINFEEACALFSFGKYLFYFLLLVIPYHYVFVL